MSLYGTNEQTDRLTGKMSNTAYNNDSFKNLPDPDLIPAKSNRLVGGLCHTFFEKISKSVHNFRVI